MMPSPPEPSVHGDAPRWRQLQSPATFLQLLYGLFIIATSAVLVTGWAYRSALLDIAASRTGTLSDAIQREDTFVAASGLLGGINIVLVVAFIVWFWRAYANLEALGRPGRRKAGWAIAAWVIPIGNFYIPYQIGSEIWRKSSAADAPPGSSGDVNVEPVVSWWALFLLMGLVNQVAFFNGRDVGDDIEKMAAVVGVDLVGAVVSIAAAVAALRFVRRATARQQSAIGIRVGMSEDPFTDGHT